MLHALPLFSIDCSPHSLDILQLAGHFIPMNLNETEQQVLSDMYQLYCADAKAAQERKDEANRAYYTEMRRNGLKLAGLSSDLINVQLTPKDVQRAIQLTLPMLYIAVGNQKFGLSKVTCCAEQLVGKRLHESYESYSLAQLCAIYSYLYTVHTAGPPAVGSCKCPFKPRLARL